MLTVLINPIFKYTYLLSDYKQYTCLSGVLFVAITIVKFINYTYCLVNYISFFYTIYDSYFCSQRLI